MPAVDLTEYEWQLGDGVPFGCGHSVDVVEIDLGATGYRSQDAAPGGRDGIRFGVDQLDAPEWVISAITEGDSGAAGFAALESIVGQWRSSPRRIPGAVQSLTYHLGGRARTVFGRPRATSPEVTGRPDIDHGMTFVDLAFQLADARIFDATERSVTLSLRTESDGGWIWPAVFPIISAPSSEQAGVIDDVGGTTDTPATITFNGPVANPWVSGPGWRIDLSTSLAADQSAVVDARPWVSSAIRSDGASLAGALSRRARLADVSLSPGSAGLTFGGIDPTATSSAVVSWRPAFHSI